MIDVVCKLFLHAIQTEILKPSLVAMTSSDVNIAMIDGWTLLALTV